MKIAAVLHHDRHADPEIFLFAEPGLALTWAAQRAREFDRFNDLREQLTYTMQRAGWLYYAQYGEGNSIRVELLDVKES